MWVKEFITSSSVRDQGAEVYKLIDNLINDHYFHFLFIKFQSMIFAGHLWLLHICPRTTLIWC